MPSEPDASLAVLGGLLADRALDPLVANVEAGGASSCRGAAGSSTTFVAAAMSCTETHSSGPWISCMPVKILGVGTPNSVSRDPSVPPRIGFEITAMPSASQAARASSTGRMSFSSQ